QPLHVGDEPRRRSMLGRGRCLGGSRLDSGIRGRHDSTLPCQTCRMNAAFAVIGSVVTVLAAVIHFGFFALETVLWSRPRVQHQFGVRSPADADVVRPWAFNQGFYNLFFAIGAGVGFVLYRSPTFTQAGFAL